MERKHNSKLTENARRLRKQMTKEERRLWYEFLRSYPVRFLRQKVIDHFIVDFYCHQARLIIELDGSQHCEPKKIEYDQARTAYLGSQGLCVLRLSNLDVLRKFGNVCEYIDRSVKSRISAT